MTTTHRLHARCGCGAAVASGPFLLSGTERKYERSRPFEIRHLDLDLRLQLGEGSVSGKAVLHFARRDPRAEDLVLDAIGFELAQVRLDTGKGLAPARHVYDGDALSIRVPKSAREGKVEVVYSASPRRGLYFLAPDETVKDRPVEVWSQCQDEDARHFVPCHDKPHAKMTTAVTLRVPSGFVALSNGDLVSKSTPRGKKPWVYRYSMREPIPSYLLTVVAGRFEAVEDRPARRDGGKDVPVTYHVQRGKAAEARRSLGETPRMIELFGRLTGVPYPFSRYGQIVVKDFVFGGMENTTLTTLYEHVLLDERAIADVTSNDLVAHELAHHWFGDHVTCRDWSHAWLNEGFATYMEHVEREDRLGVDEYEHGVRGDAAAYLSESGGRYQRPIVCRDYHEPIDLFDRHLYEKGGLVLHMLRRELGDEAFWKGVKTYLTRHGGSIVETRDLERALEETSGRSLERFFDQWVYRPGHPVLKVHISFEGGLLDVRVKQTQKVGEVACFSLPLEVEIGTRGGRVLRHEKMMEGDSDALVVRLPERPEWVTFDPRFRIVGQIGVEAPADLLRRQLHDAPTARGRILAAEALEKRGDPVTIRALGVSLGKKDESWMVRAEAARVLGKIGGPDAFRLLEGAAGTPHPKVRRAVLAALGGYHTDAAGALLARAAEKDPSYLASAEAARALGETRAERALQALVGLLDTPSWADVIRAGALDGLANLRSEAAVPHVMERTRYGHSTPTRRAAVLALAHLSGDRKVREHLEDLLDDADPHFRMSVIRALEILGDPKARGALRKRGDREQDGRVTRRIREALRTLAPSTSSDYKKTADEVERLTREMAELRTRLAKVEQSRKARPRAKRAPGAGNRGDR